VVWVFVPISTRCEKIMKVIMPDPNATSFKYKYIHMGSIPRMLRNGNFHLESLDNFQERTRRT
jgi:hypothetical protein